MCQKKIIYRLKYKIFLNNINFKLQTQMTQKLGDHSFLYLGIRTGENLI
jgi:hypothetical protein